MRTIVNSSGKLFCAPCGLLSILSTLPGPACSLLSFPPTLVLRSPDLLLSLLALLLSLHDQFIPLANKSSAVICRQLRVKKSLGAFRDGRIFIVTIGETSSPVAQKFFVSSGDTRPFRCPNFLFAYVIAKSLTNGTRETHLMTSRESSLTRCRNCRTSRARITVMRSVLNCYRKAGFSERHHDSTIIPASIAAIHGSSLSL
jgi:hypothetical protein